MDLDGTTLNTQGHLSTANKNAILYAVSRGVQIIIASGRSFFTLPEDILKITGINYAITSNGAAVYCLKDCRCLCRHLLSQEAVLKILQIMQGQSVVYEAFINGRAFADEKYIQDPVRYGATRKSISYIQKNRSPVNSMPEFILAHSSELESMDIIVHDKNMQTAVSEKLLKAVPDIYLTSSAPQLLEIAHRNAGKHTGLQYVAKILHLTRENIVAFGDGDNDCDMLTWAGCGIAVANASGNCLNAADRITDTNDCDGVAQSIYSLIGTPR